MSSDKDTRADIDSKSGGSKQESLRLANEPTSHLPTPSSPSFFEHSTDATIPACLAELNSINSGQLPQTFGAYTLTKKLGEGGAGIVFQATPNADYAPTAGHPQVALKMIRPEIITNRKAVQRFEKESRLLAEINNPHVTRHLEFGSHLGAYFIASEFIEGFSLDRISDQLKSLPAKQILLIIADLLKALSAMHSKGVIHRDVKPANVIAKFQANGNVGGDREELGDFVIAKLTDFGLARHIDQSESLAMTRQFATLGTPNYMAPEQHSGADAIDARADVYSTGVTLYHLLAGRTPFECETESQLAEMHRFERAMPLTLIRKDIGHAINGVVMKALEKDPNLRYQQASEMLADVQQILNDQPTTIRIYPETPDASQASVKSYDFCWTLDATPSQLWPLVSDTDRFNRAIGLPAPEFRYDHSGSDLKIFAKAKFNGMSVDWREHPFQWIHEREMSVLREFESGPFEWVTSTVELHPLADRKTRLLHRFQVKPRGLLGKLLTPFQFNVMTRRSLEKVYARLERLANDQSCGFACDVPFGSPPKISRVQQTRLADRVDALGALIKNLSLAERFGSLLKQVADPVAARIRPLTLSSKLSCSDDQSLQVCRSSIDAGLLNLSWDIICPVCKIAAQNVSSIEQVKSHADCKVCNIEFETDLGKTVEMIFSVHPDVRHVQLKTWCIGGPFHAPHVLAQNRLLEGQQVEMGVNLVDGKYEIEGPQLTTTGELNVSVEATESRAVFAVGSDSSLPMPQLRSGMTCVEVDNQSQVEVLVRLARKAGREDAMTADMAQRHPLFAQLFPAHLQQPEELIEVSNLHLLAIRLTQADALLDQVGDVQMRHHWSQLQQQFSTDPAKCSIEECTDASILVSFSRLEDLLDSLDQLTSGDRDKAGIQMDRCCFAIQSGEVMTGYADNQPNAFGKTIRRTKKLTETLREKELLMPSKIYQSLMDNATSASQPNTINRHAQLLSRFEVLPDADGWASDDNLLMLRLRDLA